MSLLNLTIGQSGYIDKIIGNDNLSKRLLALGCIEGTEITLKNIAPFGDPILVNLRGFNLAIRKKDAINIFLKEV